MKKMSPTKSGPLARKLRCVELKLSQSQMLVRLGFSDELYRSNIRNTNEGIECPPRQYYWNMRVRPTSTSRF